MCNMGLITEEEAEIYDRQIRLWGLESQNKLKNSNALLIGMTALTAEIAKNIVLAGIASLTIVDDKLISEEDVEDIFLIERNSLGISRAEGAVYCIQKLNPMVRVTAVSLTDNEIKNSVSKYDVIILETKISESQSEQLISLNDFIVQLNSCNRPHLICTSVAALYGFAFVDLGNHEFLSEDVVVKKKSVEHSNNLTQNTDQSTDVVLNRKTVSYLPIKSSLSLSWSGDSHVEIPFKNMPKGYFLLKVLQKCLAQEAPYELSYLESVWEKVSLELGVDRSILTSSELSCCCGPLIPAVNPIVGGIVSQEVIRCITRKGAPHGNWYFFNGLECSITANWLPPCKQ